MAKGLFGRTFASAGQRTPLLGSVALVALLVAAPGAAQDAATADAAAQPAAAFDDIIVTAQRRAESLQDVPIAVTALSGAELAARNITDVTLLAFATPGLQVGRSGSDARPNIRGINTEAIGANSDPRIAFYIDDVYQSRTSQALVGFVDLERVEVQKGPQGTLYGRNSFGGNIALYSAAPKPDFGAGASLIYGNYNRLRAEGFVNVPLSDSIAVRFAGMYEQQDGYVENTSTGSDLGDEDQYFVRGSLRFAPGDGDFEAIVRASYWKQGGNGISAFGYKSIGTGVDPALTRQPGQSLNVGGRTVTFPNGFNGQSLYAPGVPFNSRFRDGIADVNGTDVGVPIEQDPYKVNFDTVTVRDTEQWQFSADLSYDFGPVRLRSITGYTDFFALRSSDNDFSPAPIAIDYNQTKVKTFSQELQLLSDDPTSPFQWIVGGYYYNDDIREFFYSDNFTNYPVAGQTALSPFGITALPGAAFPNNARLANARSDNLSPVRLRTESLAAFGQASYNLTDALRLTAGIRHTRDEKRYAAGFSPGATPGGTFLAFDLFTQGPGFDFTCGSVTPALPSSTAANAASGISVRCGEETFSFTTWRGAVDYKLTEDNLLYASVSTGNRSGGFNNTPVSGADPSAIPFAPENVTAYEIGTKNRFLGGTLQLNLSAFLNDLSDLQVQRQVPSPSGLTTISIIENAGKARSYGVEVEAIARPIPALTINVGFTWLKSQYTQFETGAGNNGICAQIDPTATGACATPALAGIGIGPNSFAFPNVASDPDRFVQIFLPNGQPATQNLGTAAAPIPAFVYNYLIAGTGASGRTYRADLPLSPRYTVMTGIAYDIELGGSGRLTPSAQFYFNSGHFNLDFNTPLDRQEAYTRTDLRLTWLSADDRFTVQAFVENLEDTAVLNRAALGANRSLNANFAMPRTYGIRAGARF
jgi:iron complex outermembrane receptor protein